jgi:hypothetical protein
VRIHVLANRNQRNSNVKIKTLGNNTLQAKVRVGHALSARRCNSTVCLYRLNSDPVMDAKIAQLARTREEYLGGECVATMLSAALLL